MRSFGQKNCNLTSLKKAELTKTGLTGVSAVAFIVTTAWLGAVGGAIIGLKYFASCAAINIATAGGAIGGASISSTGISLMDKMNPLKHYKTAKMISKMDSAEIAYVNDIDQ